MTKLNRTVLPYDQLLLPNGDKIVLVNDDENGETIRCGQYVDNVFRVNSEGEIIWQVQRKKREKTADGKGWQENGCFFMSIWAEYPNKQYEGTNRERGGPLVLKPGWVEISLHAVDAGYSGVNYTLDIETGIAMSKTPLDGRHW